MEPVIRNILNNPVIHTIENQRLNFTWSKAIAYADDVMIITKPTPVSVQGVFSKYERLTQASGLRLNADKTEIFPFGRMQLAQHYNINYCHRNYTLTPLQSIKINGVHFDTNQQRMKELNFQMMFQKMDIHFCDWRGGPYHYQVKFIL
jgi:hypothetical protein